MLEGPARRSRRRAALTACLAVLTLAACGVPGGETDRAEVLARTCLSTIARNGLPEPAPSKLTPEMFLEERARLLESGERFNTVRPYRNVCLELRDELRKARDAAAQGDDQDTDRDDTADTGGDQHDIDNSGADP